MTGTDTAFTARFSPLTIAGMVANQTSLANFVPTSSAINTGMLSDIGRANIYAPDVQDNFYGRFMRAPLTRGDSVMSARFGEVVSRAYNPAAPDTDLFNSSGSSGGITFILEATTTSYCHRPSLPRPGKAISAASKQ